MNLTVLGKYGPFTLNGSTSGYLIESDNNYVMLDIGSGTLKKLLNKTDINNLKFLVLSHLHFDHIADLGILSYAVSFLKKDKKLKVYLYDDGSKVLEVIKDIKEFELVYIKEGEIYNDSGFTFSFYKMAHPVSSHGIKISYGIKTLSYTGDTSIDGDILNLIKGSDFLIADGAFITDNSTSGKPHMSVKEVNRISKENNIKTLLSHISYNILDKQIVRELKGNNLIKVAKENKTYKI